MKVYSDPGNFQALKISIVTKLTGCSLQTVEVAHTDCIVPYFSQSKLPVLEISEDKFLYNPNVAAKYIWLKSGKVLDENVENDLLSWESTRLMPFVCAYLVTTIGLGKKDKAASDGLTKVIKELDSKLTKSSYLLGDSMAVCDVCVFATVFPLTLIESCDILAKFPRVTKWTELVSSDPSVQKAVEEVTRGQGQDVFKASLLSQSFPVACDVKTSSSSKEKPASSKEKPPAKSCTASPPPDQVVVEKVEEAEMAAARQAWKSGRSSCPSPKHRTHPILPKDGERNLLVTSALPYVNNVPHLGNIIGCVLSADVFSRFCRLRNYNVLYICGTDEYGTATETKAVQEGVTPRQICDKYNAIHDQIYRWFNIDFDYFGRTTTDKQTEIAQDIFQKLHANGFVLKDSVEQLHCQQCQKFLADRFVEGTCPFCAYPDARGDQCDGCSKLINAVELLNPSCKMCKARPQVKTSNHLFVDLPQLEPHLRAHLEQVYASGTWTNNAKVITNSWLRDGLKPRCISRDLKWGIPIPLEGYTDKVFYVWFDAPIGYISITANYTDQWQRWWKNPSKVEMYNFLGKDNVPFHSVIFPSCLLGARDGYTVVQHMVATEYLNYEESKFSKSRGTGVFGDQASTTGIPADVFRFYLLFLRPESQDTAFSWDDFLLKNNSELLNNLGNFVNRSLSFLTSTFGGVIQPMEQLTEEDVTLMALITRELKAYITNLEACRLRDGIRNILSISRLGNQYMQNNAPWVLSKGNQADKERAGLVVSLCCSVSCLLSVLLQPYMPSSSEAIQTQLAAPARVNVITDSFTPMLDTGHHIGKPSPLFQKIDPQVIQGFKEQFAGTQDASTPSKKGPGKSTQVPSSPANPEEVTRLSQAVSDQGSKVREMKAAKADKADVAREVALLLQLKQELTATGGSDPGKQQGGGDGKKSAKGKQSGTPPATQKTPASPSPSPSSSATTMTTSTAGDAAEIDRLTKAVSEQGDKVRILKVNKAEKSAIDAEVAVLLALKRDLALAQGQDPEAATGAGKKKKRK